MIDNRTGTEWRALREEYPTIEDRPTSSARQFIVGGLVILLVSILIIGIGIGQTMGK